jgi:hypothetical protein
MTTIVQGLPVHTATATAEAAPPAYTTAPPGPNNEEALCRAMAGLGFPLGLSKELIESTVEFPVRFWVVDNSGSMNMNDGTRLVPNGAGRLTPVKTSRWTELSDTIMGIAELATTLGARTDFHLLNATSQGQCLSVGGECSDVACVAQPVTLPELKRRIGKISPSGGTPLTEAVMQVASLIEPAAAKLRAKGQKACVVLATDGLPNDRHSFERALHELQRLPVWLVVRLCTDDEQVVGYWNGLDGQLECDMEVLDDEFGEAEEVHALNGWLSYGPLLHRAREFGMHNKIFDILDEQALVPSQVKQYCETLLGCGVLPEPEADLAAFRAAVKKNLSGVPQVFCPATKAMRPWVDASSLCKPKRAGWLNCFL